MLKFITLASLFNSQVMNYSIHPCTVSALRKDFLHFSRPMYQNVSIRLFLPFCFIFIPIAFKYQTVYQKLLFHFGKGHVLYNSRRKYTVEDADISKLLI